MESGRIRYTILGLSDGLFLGIGLSLGVSFLQNYNLTLTSILLVGITGALSNMFSTYNAENYATGEQMREYKRFLFVKDYNPGKLADSRHAKSVRYAFLNFVFTLLGSAIVLAPYALFYFAGYGHLQEASVISLVVSLTVLGLIGSRYSSETIGKIKAGLRIVGIGIAIAAASSAVGLALSVLV